MTVIDKIKEGCEGLNQLNYTKLKVDFAEVIVDDVAFQGVYKAIVIKIWLGSQLIFKESEYVPYEDDYKKVRESFLLKVEKTLLMSAFINLANVNEQ